MPLVARHTHEVCLDDWVRYVVVEQVHDGGFWYDPRGYQDALSTFQSELPPGASAWAGDAGHYDFHSTCCVKDLLFGSLECSGPTTVLRLLPHPSKHVELLEIRYQSSFSVRLTMDGIGDYTPTVQLDELLPHEHGCLHEVAFHGGHLEVVAADLTATWLPLQ